MNWKTLPLVALITIGVLLVGAQAVSAAHTTEVKVYNYNPYDLPGPEISGTDLYIKKGEYVDFTATLHVDGGNPQWFRWINFYVYNANGNQILNKEFNSGFGGLAHCWINSRKWEAGNYKIYISYPGNEDDGYPPANKEIMLHIA